MSKYFSVCRRDGRDQGGVWSALLFRRGASRYASLADLYCAFGMAFLRCCYHQILGPRGHLPKFSNCLCRHHGACVRLNPHLGWQAAKSYVERIDAFALIPGHRALADCPVGAPPSSVMNSRRFMCGPPPGKRNAACRTEVACSHVSGLFTQSGWTAGPDGVRKPRPHHSSGIDVPMNRQASLGCVGSTDCAITRHYSLASSSTGPVAY